MNLLELEQTSEAVQYGVCDRGQPAFYDMSIEKDTTLLGMRTRIITGTTTSDDYQYTYRVAIQFMKVDEKEGATDQNPVQVRCSCKSYRFFFADANVKAKIHFGRKVKRYIPVPDHLLQRPRPLPKNPNDIPGMCKHVIAFGRYLRFNGIIKETVDDE